VIRVKRAYEPQASSDGRRVLVERLWPRGVTKAALAADAWAKDVAPSTGLRKWFGHRVERWPEFQRRYRRELDGKPDVWSAIADGSRDVTLLYSAHDPLHNSAIVLRDYLARRTRRKSAPRRAAASARPRRATRAR
jgi:uncharacterized protein YeaO (DUF488 family)